MLKINCLLDNTNLVEELKDAVQMVAYERAAQNQKATLQQVYDELRKAGIEIDLRTTGYLYNEVVPQNHPLFNTLQEVEELTGREISETLRKIVLNEIEDGEEQIGKLSPEEAVANGLANAFYSQIKTDEKTKSIAKVLQEATLRGAKRLTKNLKTEEPKTRKEYQEIISEALQLEKTGMRNLNGKLNNIRTLFEATQEELKKMGNEIGDEDSFTAQQWEEYMNGLEEAAYSVLFSKQEANDILTGIMKDSGFAKETRSGKKILDWVKLAGNINDVSQLRQNIVSVLEKNGLDNETAERVADSLQEEYYDFRATILQKAQQNLDQRIERAGSTQEPTILKSDFKRLEELNALGIFDRTYDKALLKTMGLPELDAEDILTIQDITKNAAKLSAELDGKDYLAGYVFQTLQRDINKIIARNISNKTRALKIITGIDKYLQFLNLGRIANAFNMLENNLSGWREAMAMNLRIWQQQGFKEAFKDGSLFKSVWKDVTKGGVGYGEELHRFSNKEYINDFYNKVDFKNADSKKEYIASLAAFVTTPGRAFLSGSDNAFKAIMHRKVMQLALHRALTQNGKSKDEANKILNEAMYGQSFEQAKAKAKDILEKYKLPVTDNTTERLANDLVIANLNTGGYLGMDTIEAAFKSGYKVAGIGLGHMAQNANIFSKKVEAHKRASSLEEQKLVKDEKWGELAMHRFQNSIYYGVIQPFISGILNWIQLRIQSGAGMGIASGLLGDWNKDIDFDSRQKLEQTIFKTEAKRQEIARGITGLAFNGLMFGMLAALAAARNDEDDEDGMFKELFKEIKGNYFLNKTFLRSAPDFVLLSYLFNTEGSAGPAALKYGAQFFNLGSEYTTNVQLARVGDLIQRQDYNQAKGKAASIVGSKFEVPLWRSYRGAYQLVKGMTDKTYKPDWKPPFTIAEGLLGGGMFEDMGLFRRDSPIEALPGIGPKVAEEMREGGIKHISDIKKHPEWTSYLTPENAKKAEEAYEEVYAE